MKNKFFKLGMSALVAATFLTGCSEESTQTAVDLNSMTIDEITEKAKEDGDKEDQARHLNAGCLQSRS